MKDIYIIMNRQNILNFYGSKLDLKLDSSELYDFQIDQNLSDFNTDVLNFTTPINYTGLTFDSSCYDNFVTPLELSVNSDITTDECDFLIRRRTEKGWTLDFVFSGITTGSTFYYLGIKDDEEDLNYADNNLSFSFTNDKRIKWESYRYSGTCDLIEGYVESFYNTSGQTPVMCTNGISTDFNITITFERNVVLENCGVPNDGGWNDLIRGPHPVPYTGSSSGTTTTQIITGYTITTPIYEWLSGDTITTEYIEELNKKWNDERNSRLGTLKIYLNGKPIYKLTDWEEVIPSLRRSESDIVQIWGSDSEDYVTKQISYYEEPLDFVHVNHNFIVRGGDFNFTPCVSDCVDTIILPPTSTPTPTPTATPTLTPTSTPTPLPATATPVPTLGFQWMTINSITGSTASGIGQNNITIVVTQSKGGMEVESPPGMYEASTFPQEYDVPVSGTQIRNTLDGVFTATFSQPVLNPLVAFASVGRPNLSVPVIVSSPFTPIWGQDTTYQNLVNGTQYTQFTGTEGFNIIRIDGTLSSVSFTYTVEEFYCTVCFGFVDQNTLPTPTPI